MGFCQSCLLPWNANQGSVQLEPNAPRHGSEMAIHNIERLPALPRMKSSIHLSLRSTTTWILLVPAYIHGFLNFSRISNDRPPSNNMRAVHISTCPTNAPNKWRKLQKKHHMVDVTLCHMNISPRPVHAGLVSSIESSQTDFIWGGGSDLLEPVSGSSGFWDISEIKISK